MGVKLVLGNVPTKRNFPKIGAAQLQRVLEANFDVVQERSSSEEITIICPSGCGDSSGNRSFNLKSNLTNCWRCGRHDGAPRIAALWLKSRGIEVDADSFEALAGDLTEMAKLADEIDASESESVSKVVSLDPPPGFTLLAEEPTCAYAELIGRMAVRKHLTLDDFVTAGVGFSREGDWEPFAIFPVYELKNLVYYQGRTYSESDEGKLTKKFPSKKLVPTGAKNWLYGFNQAIRPSTHTLIVVESILNVLSLRRKLAEQRISGVVPVAVFKHAISPPQLKKLLATPASEICLMFDGDATSSAWTEAGRIASSRKATVAPMPVGVDANDDANLAFERFVHRQQFSPVNSVFYDLNQMLLR